jgi:hypothetical protein
LLTVIVSLLLVGGALLVRYAVENSLERWKDGVEFIVFMNPDATQDQIDAVEQDLNDNPQVKSVKFYDKDQAYAEFKRLYPTRQSSWRAHARADATNFRVVPATTAGQKLRRRRTVQKKAAYFRKPRRRQWTDPHGQPFHAGGSLVFAVVLLIAAVSLIVTSVVQACSPKARSRS